MASPNRVLSHGIVAGLLGATTVAIWFLVIDLVTGRGIFFTPAAMGSAFFRGASSTAQVVMDPATILGYTLVHYAAFVLVGLIAALLARGTEESPPLIMAAVLLFVVAEALFVGLVALMASWILGALAWWAIAIGNLLSAFVMGYYLWRAHPRMRARLREGNLEAPA